MVFADALRENKLSIGYSSSLPVILIISKLSPSGHTFFNQNRLIWRPSEVVNVVSSMSEVLL